MPLLRIVSRTLTFSILGVALVACSSFAEDDDVSANVVGVNDVAKACAIRVSWPQQGTSSQCVTCAAYAESPKCDCAPYEYAGKCSDLQKKFRDEPSCAGVDDCVQACSKEDCGCVDRCYDGKDACRGAAAARDGCVAEICDSHCR